MRRALRTALLAAAGVTTATVIACGGTDFSVALDAGLDGMSSPSDGTLSPDGSKAHHDAATKDDAKADAKPVKKHDGSVVSETGAPVDSSTPDDAEPEDGSIDASGHDGGGTDAMMASCGSNDTCTATLPCAEPANACTTVACTSGCCAIADAKKRTVCTGAGTTKMVCDGEGKCIGCNDALDCAPPTTPCTVAKCEQNLCQYPPAPVNSACGNGDVCSAAGQCVQCTSTNLTKCTGTTPVCSNAGTCVACNVVGDCPNGALFCTNNACVL